MMSARRAAGLRHVHAFKAYGVRDDCGEGLSADDLVPLLTLTLVVARTDVGFEGWLLDALVSDVLSQGKESYCACTFAVAHGFLEQVQVAAQQHEQ